MKRFRLLSCVSASALGLLLATSAHAQTTATPGSKFAWDQVGQDVSTAGSATYKAYVDNGTTGVTLAGLTCTAGAPTTTSVCSANIPALAPGPHTVALTQTIGTAESSKSTALAFQFVVVVTPTGLRITKVTTLDLAGAANSH